jgi:hypothetical protein
VNPPGTSMIAIRISLSIVPKDDFGYCPTPSDSLTNLVKRTNEQSLICDQPVTFVILSIIRCPPSWLPDKRLLSQTNSTTSPVSMNCDDIANICNHDIHQPLGSLPLLDAS